MIDLLTFPMFFFNIIVILALLPHCLSVVPIKEPPIHGEEHERWFSQAMKKVDQISAEMKNSMIVEDNKDSGICGKEEVPLGKFKIGFDPNFEKFRKVFVEATIQPKHLDTGMGITADSRDWAVNQSIRLSYDLPSHVISDILGGYGHQCNVFPQDEQLKNGVWKMKETIIYNFLSDGKYMAGDRRVTVKIAFEYPKDGEMGEDNPPERPSSIYYVFLMYRNEDDKNPKVLAGFFSNRSYLKETLFEDESGGTIWKDEPDFYNYPLLLNVLQDVCTKNECN